MARRTDGEKIDELMVLVATLEERLDNARKDLSELKQDLQESRRRMWMIVPPVIAAILSAALMAAINYFIRH